MIKMMKMINRSLLSHMEKLSVAQVERLLWSRQGSNPTFRPVSLTLYQLSYPAFAPFVDCLI
jgi:hypothetical protein